MANLTAFYDTRNLYRESTQYTKPLSFEEWNLRPELHKAAILFVQFFSQITLAWDKANSYDFIEGEDGVSTICQYLEKNVPIIENNPKRFTPAYIYKVAYNCLYCICHDRKCDQDRWDNETSGIVIVDGKEVNLLETVPDEHGSAQACMDSNNFRKEFWHTVEDMGVKAEKVMQYLLSNDESDLKKVNPRCKRYKTDPLRDVEVTKDELMSILSELRKRFMNLSEDSLCKEYISRFTSVSLT